MRDNHREHQTKGKAGAGRGGKLESGEETWWGKPDRRGGETPGELVVGPGLWRCWVGEGGGEGKG